MTVPEPTTAESWGQANHRYLRAEAERLRLLLKRRVLWLRRHWAKDTGPAFQGLAISEAHADRLLARESRDAEERFYRTDPEATPISRSIQEMEAALGQGSEVRAKEGRSTSIDGLARLFGLSPFERDVVLLCLAPELDPSFELLYAYVQDDLTRKYPTVHLALNLLTHDESSWLTGRQSLAPEAPLYRHRLLSSLPAGPSSLEPTSWPLRLEARVSSFLLGLNRIDERVSDLLRPTPPALLTSSLTDLADRMHRRIENLDRQGPWPAINLFGPPGTGKQALARSLCDRLGLQLLSLDATRLPTSGSDRQEILRVLEREAVLSQLAIYLDTTASDHSAEPGFRSALGELVDRLKVFLVVGSSERWPTDRSNLAMKVPKLDAGAQKALWQQALQGVPHALNGHMDGLTQQFELGPMAISRVVSSALDRVRFREGGEAISLDDLWQECREQTSRPLDDRAQRIVPCYTWQDIVLPEDVARQLEEIAAQVSCRAQVYEEWGFGAKLDRGRGISALFSGPSGTGKTMAAEILARHLNLDLYRVDLSGVVSKYIGETEKNLRKVFDAAEQSGAILFFDEADALFGKRSEVKDSHDRYANIEVNYLLQRMEDYRGLAILATNMKSHLDPAFLRRLRFLVDFPFPDAAQRAQIWQRVFPPGAPLANLDYTALSHLEIPGGNIKNIAVNAAFLAANEGEPIGMEHTIRAARREYAKIDKLASEVELGAALVRGHD